MGEPVRVGKRGAVVIPALMEREDRHERNVPGRLDGQPPKGNPELPPDGRWRQDQAEKAGNEFEPVDSLQADETGAVSDDCRLHPSISPASSSAG